MTRYVDDSPKNDPAYETHPSYGMISVTRATGSGNLFGVDYPTGHTIRLKIETGTVKRDLNQEWFMGGEIVCEVDMSEVQYARMIATPNSTGVPCTLRTRHTEGFVRVEEPPTHMADVEDRKDEYRETARKIAGNFDHVRQKLEEFSTGKAPTKAQLRELAMWVQQAQQGLTSDLPFAIRQMEERADAVVSETKTEIDAYVHHTLAEMGRESVRERIANGEAIPLRLGTSNG